MSKSLLRRRWWRRTSKPEEVSDLYRLTVMRQREHVLVGLVVGLKQWRDVLAVIADSADPDDACARVSAQFGLDKMQSNAVLDTQYRRVSISACSRVEAELTELQARIIELERAVGTG